MSQVKSEALETVRQKTDVELKFLPTAFSVVNGSKEGNLTYDDIAKAIVEQGVAPRFIEALGTAMRMKAENHKG
jgi:hypothetical protein